jgi:hypothetical protein
MGWWFGRKSAAPDVRPFVPAWLQTDATGEGFARSYEGNGGLCEVELDLGALSSWSLGAWNPAWIVG